MKDKEGENRGGQGKPSSCCRSDIYEDGGEGKEACIGRASHCSASPRKSQRQQGILVQRLPFQEPQLGRNGQALVPWLSTVIGWGPPRKRVVPTPVLLWMLTAATGGNLPTHLSEAASAADQERKPNGADGIWHLGRRCQGQGVRVYGYRISREEFSP